MRVFQRLAFPGNCPRKRSAADDRDIAFFGDGFDVLRRQTVESGAVGDGLDEVTRACGA